MLMEDENLTEKQMEELMKTHGTLEYVSRLNRSLLLLSKIDNNQFHEVELVDFNSLLKKLIEDYSEIYGYRGVEISLEEKGEFAVQMNSTLAGILANNLLKNACEHTPDDGVIRVQLERTEAAFFCVIEDNGGGVAPVELPKLFQRFYRAEHQSKNGAGIGLAIVKEIIQRHHGNIVA